MNNIDFVKGFFKVFKPITSKYVIRCLFGIRTVKGDLTEEFVANSLNPTSQEVLSFFSREGNNDYFGIDVDDHYTNGWEDNKPTEILTARYRLAKGLIGIDPSLVFKSPRGIHAYWFLEQVVPTLILYRNLKELFKDIKHIEILPTNNHALRIPSPNLYLNNNLETCEFPGFDPLTRYSIDSIFIHGLKSDWRKIDAKTKSRKPHYTSISLAQLEKKLTPFKNGQTNKAYIELVAKYKIHGFDEDQAYDRFVKILKNSPKYTGPFLKDLKIRIETSYKRIAGLNLSQMKSLSDLYREPHIKKMIDILIVKMNLHISNKGKMRKSMIMFLLNIISWKIACDKIFKSYDTACYWSFLYPGSWARHKEGFYPLPYSLLKKWNSHYNRPLKLLKNNLVLVESPCNYSSTLKRCKYYRICLTCYDRIKGDRY